uniref:Small ribosomal subunit protein uS11c n=2 Tax=Gastrodia TaxID=91200 RepID=A0A976UFE9_9ASPA|nr:ribosomal protein S11 [Gastrodia shimizuana]YP_010471613.1 ribosomal protein S11 [Gastrodia sp. Jin 38054]UVG40952.1 ribosomal protein S11 [Gastrodia shimizuana]UVG40971.1 ribosomal protein S11 [Gastrodia sp. Jin 38054]
MKKKYKIKKKKISLYNNTHRISKLIIHIQSSLNNTIVTVSDIMGRVISWTSAGTSGFIGTRKRTPYVAQVTACNAMHKILNLGIIIKQAEVMIKGPGIGRDAALRAICRNVILLRFIRDVTSIPHNGCRPPKKKHV